MLINLLKVAWRNLARHSGFALLNAAGLAVALVCSLLIVVYVRYELSFDRYHEHAGEIHRVIMKGGLYQGSDLFNVTPGPLKAEMTRSFPEVVRACRVFGWAPMIKTGVRLERAEGFFLADPEFLAMFSFPLVAGDARTALNEPFTVILTEAAARRHFGTENPLGKVLSIAEAGDFTVTGLMKNPPPNSHFMFSYLASFQTRYALEGKEEVDSWNNNSYQTYLQLRPDCDPDGLAAKMPALAAIQQRQNPHRHGMNNEFRLQALTDIHLGPEINFEIGANSDIRYIYLFSAIGFFILLIACLNYMNLATARSTRRCREIGLRKVAGARRRDLAGQFLGESLLLTLLAAGLAVFCAWLLLPVFGAFTGRELSLALLLEPATIAIFAALVLAAGLVAGSYPAFYISSWQPVRIFGRMAPGSRRTPLGLRRTLVLTQFVISIALLVCSLVVWQQLRFIRTTSPGYSREHIITVPVRDQQLRANPDPLRDALLRCSGVRDLTFSSNLPHAIRSNSLAEWEGRTADQRLPVYKLFASRNFLEFYQIKLKCGRSLAGESPGDGAPAYILNETAVKALGWQDPAGRRFDFARDGQGRVAGVMADFHFSSLRQKIEPLALALITDPADRYEGNACVSIRIAAEDQAGTLARIEPVFKRFSPAYPFNFSFLDEQAGSMYQAEQKLGEIFNCFTVIAVLIAALGLFGLSLFAAGQRTREIGIRKVLGSSVPAICLLLNREMIILLVIAAGLAWPLAGYGMSRWLEGFAYRIEPGPGTFALSGLLMLLVALLTVSGQSLRAARANPVESLRHE